MKGNKIFDFSRKGFQDIINIMTRKINECVDVSNGLIPRLDEYISKVDWNKIINSDLYQDYSNRVPDEVLNMIESVTLDNKNINELIPLTDENERDVCSICITPYREGEVIKLMPCNKKHIFHKCCIDKWLKHNKACPTCRREINKKLINKTKIY